jgi:hypothetical protein
MKRLIAVAAVLALAGCQGTKPTDHGNGTPVPVGSPVPVGGLVAKGQLVGSLRIVGGPYPGINRAENGHVLITTVGQEVSRAMNVTATKQKGFAISIAPGRYRLAGTPEGWTNACQLARDVVVRPGQLTHANVICDVP